jgi:hypothetical protein
MLHRGGRRHAGPQRNRTARRRGTARRGNKYHHCEEQSDEAIQSPAGILDCFASFAMTGYRRFLAYLFDFRFDFFAVFFAAFRFFDAFFGTFLPLALASDRPIAIACLRLLTFLPERPLFRVPALRFFIARLTSVDAFFEYLRAIDFLRLSSVWQKK